MKKLIPYKTVRGALSALDNGGRFYNLFSRAGDGLITAGELSKATGRLSNLRQSALYFEMMLMELNEADRETVIARLDPKLRSKFRRSRPQKLEPSALGGAMGEKNGIIVEGQLVYSRSQKKFTSFVMIPIQSGSVTTYMMLPIYEQFSMYQFKGAGDASIPVAISKKAARLPSGLVRLGGFIREASSSDTEPDKSAGYFSVDFLSLLER